MAKNRVLHVPYKGAGLSVGGDFRRVAVTIGRRRRSWCTCRADACVPWRWGGKRSALWPDLLTIIEAGLPGYVSMDGPA
jgi:hypothetical protein